MRLNALCSSSHITAVQGTNRKEADIAQKSPKSSPYKANGLAPSYGSPLRYR